MWGSHGPPWCECELLEHFSASWLSEVAGERLWQDASACGMLGVVFVSRSLHVARWVLYLYRVLDCFLDADSRVACDTHYH